jgi:hypothetical protein
MAKVQGPLGLWPFPLLNAMQTQMMGYQGMGLQGIAGGFKPGQMLNKLKIGRR